MTSRDRRLNVQLSEVTQLQHSYIKRYGITGRQKLNLAQFNVQHIMFISETSLSRLSLAVLLKTKHNKQQKLHKKLN